MATIDIPDKICSHCGGTRWVEMKNKSRKTNDVHIWYYCAKKLGESTRKYHKTPEGKKSLLKAERTQIMNLTDYYIINNIAIYLWNNGLKLDRKSITQEQIEMYREAILVKRQLKQLKNQLKIKL